MNGHFVALSILLCLMFFTSPLFSQAEQPNILFIVCDDLNDWVEGYNGHPQTVTPNVFALEQLGTTFLNANTAATLCAPSRTSFILGKRCESFRGNFPPELTLITMPEYLKDAGGYFTFGINKIFHCNDAPPDYDTLTADPCARILSWNKALICEQDDTIQDLGQAYPEGIERFKWAKVDSQFADGLADWHGADSAIAFLNDYAAYPENYCDRPFFLAWGIHLPHSNLYIPEQYFNDFYLDDFYVEPYAVPYNHPADIFPYNGIVMPPQPDNWWSDLDSLGPLAIEQTNMQSHKQFKDWPASLSPMPVIDDALTDMERDSILAESKRANAVMAYLAGIHFGDEQIGRVMDALESYPELYNNTIIIYTSDHGFSMGEKKHWGKSNLWETDVRVPLVIADLRDTAQQKCYRSVNLLDLFPTLCDYAGIPYPLNPDGTPYLNGNSIVPLMNDPSLYWETPTNTQIKNSMYGDNCFVQNSIRNNRFHYIRFASNAGVGETGCNVLTSYPEEELYDIGEHFETDPNEWNNLIGNEDYRPLIDYLCQWLPDSANYFEKAFTVLADDHSGLCSVQYADTLLLSATLYDTSGLFVAVPEPEHIFKWTNNLTADEFTGADIQFPMSLIPEALFDDNGQMIIYLSVFNNVSGKYEAFEMRNIYLHQYPVPATYFSAALTDTFTVTISDHTITGDYDSSWWDMGNGDITGIFPETYHYGAEGVYTITNYVSYSAGDTSCIVSYAQTIIIDTIMNPDTVIETIGDPGKPVITIYPNPATNELMIEASGEIYDAEIKILNELGQILFSEKAVLIEPYRIDISKLPAGNYILQMLSGENNYHIRFEVLR